MRREWEPEDLVACWTLVDDDWRLVGNKTGATRLGFAVLLKFFELEARFPRHAGEVPKAATAWVAKQVKVDPSELIAYAWDGRTIKSHRAQVREALGFRESTTADEDHLTTWLAEKVCPVELSDERQREALLVRCRAERLEPPATTRIDRIIGAACAAFEKQFCAHIVSRLSPAAIGRLEELITDAREEGMDWPARSFLAELKADPGQLGLETLLREIAKLERIRAIGLPAELIADVSEKLVAAWRARAAKQYPSDLRASPMPMRLTLLASLCWARTTEITDSLVDLLIALVHKSRPWRICGWWRRTLVSGSCVPYSESTRPTWSRVARSS
jgi:hypothetical protein